MTGIQGPVDSDLMISIAGMITGLFATGFISIALVKIFRGPVGQAVARRITHRGGEGDLDVMNEVAGLRGDVEHLQQRLAEAEERIDFSERLLANRSESVERNG